MRFFLFGLMFLLIGITAGLYRRVSPDMNAVGSKSELPAILQVSQTEAEVAFRFLGKTPFERQSEVIAYLANGGTSSGKVFSSEPFVTALLAALEATDDPRLALSRLSADGYAEDIATQLIFHQWAHKNLSEAYQAATQLPPGPRQISAIEATLVQALRHDKAAFSEMFLKHYHKLRPACLALLATEDPEELCRIMETVPPRSLSPVDRVAFKEWAKTDPESAWERARSWFGSEGSSARIAVAQEWAKTDPAAVEALIADTSTPSRDKMYLRWFVIKELAKSNPTEALERSMELSDSDQMNAVSSLIEGISGGDLRTAWDFAESIEEPEARNALIGMILSREARTDLGDTIAWFERQSDPEMRAIALESFGRLWAEKDPETVAEYLADVPPNFQSDYRLNGVIGDVASKLTFNDPHRAAAWAETLPGDLQSDALNDVINHWGMTDVRAAASYIGSSHQLPLPETAVATLVSRYFLAYPKDSLLWVDSIESQTLRDFAEAEINQMVLMAAQMQEAE